MSLINLRYNGFNTVVATTNFDSFSIDTNKYYIIELERNRLVASLTIYDYITKESVSVSYKFSNGFFFDELYVIGKVSGGNVVIKEFNVNIMLNIHVLRIFSTQIFCWC